jgi:hypothetical protein
MSISHYSISVFLLYQVTRIQLIVLQQIKILTLVFNPRNTSRWKQSNFAIWAPIKQIITRDSNMNNIDNGPIFAISILDLRTTQIKAGGGVRGGHDKISHASLGHDLPYRLAKIKMPNATEREVRRKKDSNAENLS